MTKMSLEQTACEDLKAFERRLTEVIAKLRPATNRWRFVLLLATVGTCWGAGQWLWDPRTATLPLASSLLLHWPFAAAATVLALLLLTGTHRKVIAPSIVAGRSRKVLKDFNMSCDDTGKLILKPRPQHPYSSSPLSPPGLRWSVPPPLNVSLSA